MHARTRAGHDARGSRRHKHVPTLPLAKEILLEYAQTTSQLAQRRKAAMLKILVALIFSAIAMLAAPAVAQQYTPVPNQTQAGKEGACRDEPGRVVGQKGYNHCRDHLLFPEVFTTANCSCSVGQCRETEFRTSPKSPSGVVFKVVGDAGVVRWCPIKSFIDMRKVSVPAELDGEAYVCIEDGAVIQPDGCPRMEDMNCNLLRAPS